MNRPCHILTVVTGLAIGGDENRIVSMVRAMDPSKYRFFVLVLPLCENFTKDFGSIQGDLEALGVEIHQLYLPQTPEWLPRRLKSLIRMIRDIFIVARFVKARRVDIVDAHLDGAMMIAVPAAFLVRRPSISTLYYATPCYKFPFWWLMQAVTLNLSTAVVTDSGVRQAELGRWVVRKRRPVWNIPNGISAPIPRKTAEEVRHILGIPNERGMKIIAQIAGLIPTKGQLVLLNAASRVLEAEPRAFFLIIGFNRSEYAYAQELHETVRRLRIEQRVRIASYPDGIGDVWQLVDIHAHPTHLDSLPNAILEGMSLGKPAVVTKIAGIPEAVQDKVSGLVIPPNDPSALADALLQLLRNAEEAAQFGKAAHVRYLSRYDAVAMTRDLATCFQSVLKQGATTLGNTI